jgi:hypothetical protein
MVASHGMSREGLAPGVIATGALWLGHALLLHAGRHYLDSGWALRVIALGGLAGLVVAGTAVTRLVRRADYPWLMLVAALAIPLFEPQNKPDTLAWRLFSGLYGLVLVVVAAHAFTRMVARTDELERRINHEALAFAFAVSLVGVMAWSLLQVGDLLPQMSGKWVATGMIVAWLAGWNAAARRYR